MGGSIEDDSTDEAEIEKVANQIADVAKESQGEATRWANKAKEPKEPKRTEGTQKNLKNRRSQRNLITIQTNGSPNFKRKWIK